SSEEEEETETVPQCEKELPKKRHAFETPSSIKDTKKKTATEAKTSNCRKALDFSKIKLEEKVDTVKIPTTSKLAKQTKDLTPEELERIARLKKEYCIYNTS